jgi:hypothetical protein
MDKNHNGFVDIEEVIRRLAQAQGMMTDRQFAAKIARRVPGFKWPTLAQVRTRRQRPSEGLLRFLGGERLEVYRFKSQEQVTA